MDNRAYPPTYRSRPKRHNWRAWIVALAAAALFGSMCGLSFVAESAAAATRPAPCRSERAAWRKAQQTLVIAGQRPGDYWTAQAALLQCQREYRER